VNAALAGVVLAAFLPTRPAPAAGPLLAQAATALSALEQAENQARAGTGEKPAIEQEPIWEWASRNLSAASERLSSPAERVERAVSPWVAYLALPLFALSATGVSLNVDLGSADAKHVLVGVVLGLLIGKPLGVALAALAGVMAKVAVMPEDISLRLFLGGAILCGVGDPIALLLADQAFPQGSYAAVAKIGVLIGSALAAVAGSIFIATSPSETKFPTSQRRPLSASSAEA
jgi:NhaA family Na+:H+ antiporter